MAVVKATAEADPESVVEAFAWLGGMDPEAADRVEAALRYLTGLDVEIPEHLRTNPDAIAVRGAAGSWAVPVTDLRAALKASGSGNGESQ